MTNNGLLHQEIIAGIGLRNQGEYVRDGSKSQHLIPKLSVSNIKNGSFCLIFEEFCRFIFLKFETPPGIADLTASTASDAVPHSQLWRNGIFLVAAATSTIAQLRRA